MRDDMAKVVTERPRRGHGNKSKKTTGPRIRRYDSDRNDEEPVRLPISRRRQYGYQAKELTDLISPLKRYLRSCVGRPCTSQDGHRPRADVATRGREARRLIVG